MSTVETGQRDWAISEQNLDSKYEKCLNITEEIYKRIDITFQIKKLEAGQSELSDNSELLDSNELSNETDLFACDKSDITSSTEAEKPPTDCNKFININNNEVKDRLKVYKRPKKRFRKRVKKRTIRARSDSEGSSDEAPLSRIADPPNVPILAAEIPQSAVLKQKTEKRPTKKTLAPKSPQKKSTETVDKSKKSIDMSKTVSVRIDRLENVVLSMKDNRISRNYTSFMKDNKLTIKSHPITKDELSTKERSMKDEKLSLKEDNLSLKDVCLSMNKDNLTLKDANLSMKDDNLSKKTDKLSMKDSKEKITQWKNCSLCSLTFRGERGLRRHISMSHITPED